ncbi:phosphonate ABC transporter, permease protein PhnE [Anaerobranca gottschalkii]|nr:phosphonate ABC transporter, permease protein PhnE [Anaerobranca gottschalkii]
MNWYKRHIVKGKIQSLLTGTIIVILLIYSGYMVKWDFVKIYQGIPSMYNLIQRMFYPNFAYINEVMTKLLETLEIAFIASILGVFLAIPMGLLTAANTTPTKIFPVLLNPLFSLLRTIPNLIWAALLVSLFSIGIFPGIIALTITAFLVSLKLFREHIEGIEENSLNSLKAVGANSWQILGEGILPIIKEHLLAVFFIVLEINIRSATVLGLVGAGGIGQILWRDLNHLRYDNIATLLLILFITIGFIDLLSLVVRNYSKKIHINFNNLGRYIFFTRLARFSIPFLVLLSVIYIYSKIDLTFARFILGLEQGQTMILRMTRLDWSYLPQTLKGIKESLFITLFATIVGGINTLFLSYLAADNVSPSRGLAITTKFIINILRTFPPIITAVIFFRGVGPGPLAGAMALSLYTTGVLTKLYSEVVENTHGNIKDSILVVGGNNLHCYRHGIIPQTLPNYLSLLLYRLESNIRTSSILGVIGAGGIGSLLTQNITWRNWEKVGLLLLSMALLVMIIDRISYLIRKIFV